MIPMPEPQSRLKHQDSSKLSISRQDSVKTKHSDTQKKLPSLDSRRKRNSRLNLINTMSSLGNPNEADVPSLRTSHKDLSQLVPSQTSLAEGYRMAGGTQHVITQAEVQLKNRSTTRRTKGALNEMYSAYGLKQERRRGTIEQRDTKMAGKNSLLDNHMPSGVQAKQREQIGTSRIHATEKNSTSVSRGKGVSLDRTAVKNKSLYFPSINQ